jgi:endonuclease YncB( thermonuclease family)
MRVLLLLLALHLSQAQAEELIGTVVRVADGDTLTVSVGGEPVRVRLTEIDAPERGQPYNQVARRSLVELCMQQPARVDSAGQDKYGRTLGRVYCDGVDANAEQVRRGLAWAFTRYLTDPEIARIEASARDASVGLWRDSTPQPPWEWRAAKSQFQNSVGGVR